MTTTQLTPAQHAILAKAINTSAGKIEWFPDNIKGGARKKVLDGLFNRALITPDGEGWCVAAEGYDALGMKRPRISKFEANLDAIIANAESAQDAPEATAAAQTTDAELEADVAACEAEWAKNSTPAQAKPRTRDNSKQAEVIRMLQRPEGATIGQICTATGWQAHTVRGTFAGAFKKKLGLTITSDKPQGGERVYRIA
ncbi:TPA: DUF3489 domain-containing protein [Pseudomonas aeruginosa]|uniref:DUF3489 domain-containing protein n=1 Tax=Gammaproteobacteria TaxID=1236 RepID=UPI000668E05A|nr:MULTISPECIES: DUF3489 domain-containing protein [Gammaproteobacteria]KRG85589.1 hypothetical protein ABB33_06825 [Stenotrophomonas acidaminiphila]MBA5623160.1 DUF3489 domain-containing protein [Pseudomonas aeruginosa]MBI7315488.1 DUF3489 domain-containing protein [Pseudomonas aeruginosa]MBI7327792.1 DUF3489 domain-containing protein [Pseudomonas aeruginosa]MBI7496163.1 DUF3489 domain-containing protein [Pseudomonas aeruginosa]